MKLLDTVGRAFKAASQTIGVLFGRSAGGWRTSTLSGRGAFNYAASVGDGRGNAIVVACVEAFVTAFSEAPLRVQRIQGKDLVPVPDHPMIQLLARPNPYYSGVLLLKAFVSDWLLGNAYLLKVRGGSVGATRGRVVELYWIPSSQIEPRWDANNGEYIGWYDYTVDGQIYRYDPSDVVHLRNGFDPTNVRKGLSRLAALLREIATDDEAANFSAALLRNMGVPGLVISPSDRDTELTEADAETIKAQAAQRYGGDNRGATMVVSAPINATSFGFNPQQMDLKALRRVPEERISAAVGVPAIVAGLGAGLDRSTYSNMEEAREMFYETSIVPAYRLFAAEFHSQLVSDFEDVNRVVVDFDISKVRVLQADEDALHTRIREDVKAGLLTINQGREKLGWDQLDGCDVLLLPVSVMATDPATLLESAQAAPEPMPTPVPAAVPAVDALPIPKALTNGVHA